PIHDARKESEHGPLTDAERKVAARESSTTHSPREAVADCGERVDPADERRYAKQAEENREQVAHINQARRERYELETRLRRAREDGEERGIDISSPQRVIERQLAKIERRVYEGKAA